MLKTFVRFMPPILAAVMIFLQNLDFLAPPPDAKPYKLVGLLLPALWLTSVGPTGLIKNGGFLMRQLRVKPTRRRVELFGLSWLCLFLIAAICVERQLLAPGVSERFTYGVAYAGLMGSMGVFAFLAVEPE